MSCALARSSSCRVARDFWSVSKAWVACWMCWSHACSTSRLGSVSVMRQLLSQGSGAAWAVSFIFAPHLAPDHAGVALHGPGEEGEHLAQRRMVGVAGEDGKRVTGFIHEGHSSEQISGIPGGQGTPRAGLHGGKPQRTFRQIENLCHGAFLSRRLLVLFNERGGLFSVNAPLWSQDRNVLAVRSGVGLSQQEGKIFGEPIPECPDVGIMYSIGIQVMCPRQFPRFLSASAVQAEPPGPESEDKSHTEEQ